MVARKEQSQKRINNYPSIYSLISYPPFPSLRGRCVRVRPTPIARTSGGYFCLITNESVMKSENHLVITDIEAVVKSMDNKP